MARAGHFVGLANFVADWHDPVFWQVVQNTFVYTFAATILKMIGGLGLALVMNQDFRFKNLTRAVVLLPFIVPTVLSTICLDVDPRSGIQRDQLVPDSPGYRQSRAIVAR